MTLKSTEKKKVKGHHMSDSTRSDKGFDKAEKAMRASKEMKKETIKKDYKLDEKNLKPHRKGK